MWTRLSTPLLRRRCTPPFSFYHDLIPKYWHSARGDGERGALRWLCTISRRMGARALIVEDALAWPHVEAEVAGLEVASLGLDGWASAAAITFLSQQRRGSPPQAEDVLAQAIVVTFPRADGPHSYIFEGHVRLPGNGTRRTPLLNNYLPLARDVEVRADGGSQRFKGIYFCEQNQVTSVCAHSALRTVVHALTGETPSTAALAGLLGPTSPNNAVSSGRLRAAIESFGYKAQQYDFRSGSQSPAASAALDTPWGIMCSAIEAGHPALLVIATAGRIDHVLPVIGYTVNTDEWHPHAADLYRRTRAAFLSSRDWIDHLIVNDDMAGPHYCLAQFWEAREGSEARPQVASAAVITVRPDEVHVTPAFAEPTAHSALLHLLPRLDNPRTMTGRWWRFLVDGLTSEAGHRPVLRTTLVERGVYLDHLRQIAEAMHRDLGDAVPARLEAALPEAFWMCEISLPNLYVGNRAKLGEMLIRTAPRFRLGEDRSLDWVCGFRLPSLIGWREEEFAYMQCAIDRHARLIGAASDQEW